MDKIIVYLDDAEFARRELAPMKLASPDARPATHWILVACPPRMTRHISKWVNRRARESWRNKWAENLFRSIAPVLEAQGDQVTTVLPHGLLVDQTRELILRHGAARVLDARRPKFGQDMLPVTADQPAQSESRWSVPGAVAGMGAALVLAAE